VGGTGQPVSVAGVRAAPAGVARVGPVDTPAPRRRNGYGAAVTAAATDGGTRGVALYTDLPKPTSDAIFRAIGFGPDHDALR
jgi:predicted GNAT family acetyltransferase